MAVPVFVGDVGAVGIEDAEVASEVPDAEADLVLSEDIQHVAEPGEKHGVGRAVPAATLAAMHAHAFCYKIDPWFITELQALPVVEFITVKSKGVRPLFVDSDR